MKGRLGRRVFQNTAKSASRLCCAGRNYRRAAGSGHDGHAPRAGRKEIPDRRQCVSFTGSGGGWALLPQMLGSRKGAKQTGRG